jgi:hypothetical protein
MVAPTGRHGPIQVASESRFKLRPSHGIRIRRRSLCYSRRRKQTRRPSGYLRLNLRLPACPGPGPGARRGRRGPPVPRRARRRAVRRRRPHPAVAGPRARPSPIHIELNTCKTSNTALSPSRPCPQGLPVVRRVTRACQ